MATHEKYDLAIAWTWEYDRDFVCFISEQAAAAGKSVLQITAENIAEIIPALAKGQLQIRFLLDRASDESEAFLPMAEWATNRHQGGGSDAVYPINAYDCLRRAADKATMHLEFLSHQIQVPYSIIISPYDQTNEIELSLTDLSKLGRPFIIKPANTTGGGFGVIMGAETLKDVLDARKSQVKDKYLLQETIYPLTLYGKRAWFRIFYAFGAILPCWWDDQTHLYTILTDDENNDPRLKKMVDITARIQTICQLDFFSTELVLTSDDRLVAVDYVNEMCDMRLQSKHKDGVPDEIVRAIIWNLLNFIAEPKNGV